MGASRKRREGLKRTDSVPRRWRVGQRPGPAFVWFWGVCLCGRWGRRLAGDAELFGVDALIDGDADTFFSKLGASRVREFTCLYVLFLTW